MNPKVDHRQQAFEVVLLPPTLSQFSAKAADYRRVRVLAANDLGARFAPEVAELTAQGLYIVECVYGGAESPAIERARDATPNGDAPDPGLRSPNSERPSGLPTFPSPRTG